MSLTVQSSIHVYFSTLKCIQITDSGWIGKCKFKMRIQFTIKHIRYGFSDEQRKNYERMKM